MQHFFTQGIAVLFSQAPDLGSLRQLFERQGCIITADEDATEWREMQGACLTLATDFENGAVCWVDICEFPWPDDMGATGDPTLLTSAHALGAFGPFVHTGALERALQAPGYQAAVPTAHEHRAFVRLRTTHFFQAPDSAEKTSPAKAENARPLQELGFLLKTAAALAELPGALAYFNPNSEMILPLDGLGGILSSAQEHKTFPIEAVCRLRGCPAEESWSFVDCIGMAQLGMRDHEFAWEDISNTRTEQIHFLVNLLHYQADNTVQIESGHTTDGPNGQRWRAQEREESCMVPPRKVLHWTLEGAPPEPEQLAARPGSAPPETNEESALFSEASEIMAKLDAWQALRSTIHQRAVSWLRSTEFRTVYYDDAHVPFAMKIALEMAMSKKKAQDTWQQLQYLGQQTPQLWNQYQQLATHGQVWFAVPMMTNPAFATEKNTLLPCGVIVAAEQTSTEICAAGIFAMVAYEVYSGEGDAAKFPGTAKMMSDDSYRVFYREAFPLTETHGRHFTLLSVLLRHSWMPPKDVPFIPLLAMPGPQGAVVQIPWHIATGTPPLPGSADPGRFAEVAALDPKTVHKPQKRGCWDIISLIIWAIFLTGVIGGIVQFFIETPSKPSKTPQLQKKVSPQGASNQK
ncbi:DUF4261 domain-containing protein [Prosthecobacter sp.]|uniref:DUF4261 domain-containing protein n=1 Tax=Prosthecobacter sp. TaxID=1965333 RepID=UPI00378531C3